MVNTTMVIGSVVAVLVVLAAVLVMVMPLVLPGPGPGGPGAGSRPGGISRGGVTSGGGGGGAEEKVRQAFEAFHQAIHAMFRGDLAPMSKVWSHSPDVTLMPPFGQTQVGWNLVLAEFGQEAAAKLAGQVTTEDLRVVLSPDNQMACTTCIETGQNMTKDGKPIAIRHRATSIYRLEDGVWKMIHHHTDTSPALQQRG